MIIEERINLWPLKYSLATAFIVARVAEVIEGTVAIVPIGSDCIHLTIEKGSQGRVFTFDTSDLFQLDSTDLIRRLQDLIDHSIREFVDQMGG